MLLFFLGTILPYLAVATFLLGMAWRTWDWLSKSVPFPLTVSAAPGGIASHAFAVAAELTWFGSLYRGDRRLWLLAWLMHASLLLILLGHLVGIALAAEQFRYFGASKEASVRLSGLLGISAGLVLVAALLALSFRRMASEHVKRISALSDYLPLMWLLAVAGTGMAMRLLTAVDLADVRAYLAGLLLLSPRPLPDIPLFIVHFTAVNVLLIYFPYSKLVHLTGAAVSRSLLVQPPPVYPTPTGSQRTMPWASRGGSP